MKKLAILALLALELAVCGCGSSTPQNSTTTTAGGSWEALLSGGKGAASELSFVTKFDVTDTTGANNQPLSITGFSFINAGACFANGVGASTEAGNATLNTSGTNQVTGTLNFTVTSVTPAGNTLSLTGNLTGTSNGTTTTTGTLTNGVVSGTWTLTGGSDCTGGAGSVTGPFLMCQGSNNCTAP
jgi:hypothetical protein